MKKILIVSLVVLISCKREYKIVRCKDADTFVLSNGETVRLKGCDALELHQFMGDRAKSFADSILLNKVVSVSGNGHDKYGRRLASITVGEKDYAELLVDAGYAFVYRKYSSEEMYERFLTAKEHKKGAFTYDNIIAPYNFRKSHKN